MTSTSNSGIDRVLLHITHSRRVPVDPAKIYLLEADGGDTIIRTRSKKKLRDVRRLGELLTAYEPHGFLRIHRNHAVNLRRIREITQRPNRNGWQVKLQPPVNRVLPVGQTHLAELWHAFGNSK
ncbi:MAG: LytTR family DNA-binding domain-containing protein [Pirellulales bacterium]